MHQSSSGRITVSATWFAAVALLAATAARADVSVSARLNPQRLEVGEAASLTIEVQGAQDAAAPALGEIKGFEVRYIGPSTQVAMVNGRMSASVQHRYALQAREPGHYTL